MEDKNPISESSPETNIQESKSSEPDLTKTSEVKPKGTNKAIFIVLGFFVLATISLLLVVAYLLFSAAQNPSINDPIVSATPTTEPELTPTPESSYIYYLQEGLVYRRDLETQESELIPLGEVQWGGQSALAGVTYPIISKDQTKLAFIPEIDQLGIYDLEDETTQSVTLPKPTKGETEVFIAGFNSDSSKLLFHLGCITPIDDVPEGFEYCPDDFIAQKLGLYVYDLNTALATKVTTQSNEWETYDNIIGWVSYDADKFVVTKDEYQDNSLDQTEIFEIDTDANTHRLLGNGNGDMVWYVVWDFDQRGRMLYQQYDDNKWELYIDDKLIVEESGFTSMQFPLFYNNRSDRITYYSNTSTTIDFKIVDVNGNLLGTKDETFEETSPTSYRLYNQYLLEYLFNDSVNIYDISDPSNFELIDTIEGKVWVIGIRS